MWFVIGADPVIRYVTPAHHLTACVDAVGLAGCTATEAAQIMHYAAAVQESMGVSRRSTGPTNHLPIIVDGNRLAIRVISSERAQIVHYSTTVQERFPNTGCREAPTYDLPTVVDRATRTLIKTG